jgi:mannose-6-phosphate isomerase-like protein (cupin superfamily)
MLDVKHILAAIRFRDDKLSKVNLFETENFFLDLYCMRPGQAQAVHSHAANDKVYCVLRGEGRVTVGEETRTLRANEAVLAAAGEPHGIENASTDDLVCLVLMAPRPPSKTNG